MLKYFCLCLLGCLSAFTATAQTCTGIGQNPTTAFPVCGTKVFSQASVAICGGRRVVGAKCSNVPLEDVNPYWYKFTCFEPGTLGFLITPNDMGDDYDWQLFDVTGKDVMEVYTNEDLFVACNWSGEPGLTGASSAGNNLTVCDGLGRPLYSSMPRLIKDHEYLLLISHFTQTQSGYKLEFKGGTASITDTVAPRIVRASYNCANSTISVKLNKKMQCSTLATNGSDFALSAGPATITGASATSCTGFDMDSIILQLSRPLPDGNYNVTAKTGSDANTILDICGNGLPVGERADFSVLLPPAVRYDSMAAITCQASSLKIIFKDAIRCSSVAANGSDFRLTGPAGVSITSAATSCQNDLTKEVVLNLNGPVNIAGNFTLTLVAGTDGNTVLSECRVPTPAGGTLAFSTLPPVSANFNYNVALACNSNSVAFTHDGNNFINSWNWFAEGVLKDNAQNPVLVFDDQAPKKVTLVVTNGLCADTASADLLFPNYRKADFTMMHDVLCPQDFGVFRDASEGNIIGYRWEFGNGKTSDMFTPPPQLYPQRTAREQMVAVLLIIENDYHCFDTATRYVKLVSSCYTDVPTAFTPNKDGLNDYLYPLNGYKTRELEFRVFNRYGNLVFQSADWTRKWDGTVNGHPAEAGPYAWMLRYTDRDTGEKFFLKGTTLLLR